jgi:hypothetical protein
MRDTSSIGNKSEAMVLAALVHAGHWPMIPFGGGHPYDIALDDGGRLLRVQCKTGRLVKGAVVFPTAIMCRNNTYRSYRGDVDYFGVYCRGTAQVYLVPIADVPARTASLRVAAPLNGQTQGLRWAKDYLIWQVSAAQGFGLASSGPGSGDDPLPAHGVGQLRSVP